MPKDELLLISGFDQDMPTEVDEGELLDRVRDEINRAADTHDVERAVKICAFFQKSTKLAGKSLAKALYVFATRWDEFEIGEDFIDYIEARIGLVRHTVERYIKVAALLDQVPDEYRDRIEHKGIQQLIPIASAKSQGYEINDEHWDAIAKATSYYEVQQIINSQVKHVESRENALALRLHRDGSIVAYRGEESPKFVGSLEVSSTDSTIVSAIERITKNCGILSV